MNDTSWFLYALRCGDDTLYTGVTTDVPRRLREHNSGQGARYTSGRRPVRLVGAWRFGDQSAAQRAEAAFRRLPRREKLPHVAQELPVAGAPFCRDGAVSEHLDLIRFCHRCGGLLALTRRRGEEHAQHVCTACGRTHYRNAIPCAGALVQQDGRLLLVKRAIEPYLGCWDIPGGFLELEEHPEAGAVREVREETGLSVEIIDLFGMYTGRYVYDGVGKTCLNVYYSAWVAGGTEEAGDDAADLAWFAPDELPEAIAFEHAREVLAEWKERERRG